ncbi:attachment p12 family protein [Winogradskyella epiphytica]|uniref:Attachment p12 family protein n=1 Tax=Winogradskyella epiphytica TaxID=262005 RepID=A0A2V4YH08_9FLAO|nr:FeoB-associated Cys-rich membrane protein [Winogradskyella epiphytica]PYE83203.1 attachment p12 family protein [Winogradskyella epiphytica]
MNTIIQNILVFAALGFALLFLIRKFIWSPKKKSTKACGGDDGCGCH